MSDLHISSASKPNQDSACKGSARQGDNIDDTNVEKIIKETREMIVEISTTVATAEKNEEYLQKKYNYLYRTSKTLFNMILKEVLSNNFNKEKFENKINTMLEYIIKIQQKDITTDKASEYIGKIIAKEYIPKNLYKGDDYVKLYEN